MRSYKVETEFGTFARKTGRTYTHIIIARLSPAERLKKIGYAQAHVDYIRNVIETHSPDANGIHWSIRQNGECSSGYRQEDLVKATAELNRKLATINDYFAATWCGRADLAIKALAQWQKRPDLWADVRMVEVK